MWRHLAANTLTFLIVALFLLVGAVTWGAKQYRNPGPLAEAICLEVPSGVANVGAVTDTLVERGAIGSGFIYEVGARYSEKYSAVKAGSFRIPPQASPEEIVDIITRSGPNSCGFQIIYRIGINRAHVNVREIDIVEDRAVDIAEFDLPAEDLPIEFTDAREATGTDYSVVVAEGTTSWQVLNGLRMIDILDANIDDVPAEGTLAPDAYDVRIGDKVSDLLAQMAAKQETILADAWTNRAEGLPVETPEEALILASLIEKETGVPTERRQVASVFVNRLERGMRLQTDPAVIYGITRGEGVLGRGLRQSELRGETPWNTYVIPALPPTPIANPGRASIEAALNPDTTEYVFFVADGTGGHAFATNLEDHNRNVARWREIEAERANNDG